MNTKTLKEITKDAQIVSKAHDPKKYFQDRKGLYVYSGFTERILSNAKKTKAGTEFKVSSFELVEPASDETIEGVLGDNHIFSETDVCAIISSLIDEQPNGEEGTLLKNGYANLFYTPSRVVSVDWDGDEWSVGAWDRGGIEWFGGWRVFSPATDARALDSDPRPLELDAAIEIVKDAGYRVIKEM